MLDKIEKLISDFSGHNFNKSIEIYDKNAGFRQQVAAYLIDHPQLASLEIVERILLQESILSRSSQIDIELFAGLLSLYLELCPVAAPSATAFVGFSMDVDGALQSGKLQLSKTSREEAIYTLDGVLGKRTSAQLTVIRNSVEKAGIVRKPLLFV